MKDHGHHGGPGEEVVPLRLPLFVGGLEARFVRNSPSPPSAHMAALIVLDLPFLRRFDEAGKGTLKWPSPGHSDYEAVPTPTSFRGTRDRACGDVDPCHKLEARDVCFFSECGVGELSMKNGIAPSMAILSVLALFVWVSSSARRDPSSTDPSATELKEQEAVSAPVLREQTEGSAVPCAAPLGWRIVRVDESFELSRAEARAALDKAASFWEDAVGPGLFSNESDGVLPVRFVYEDRQENPQTNPRRVRGLAGVYREGVHMLEGRMTSVTREIRIYRFDSSDDLVRVAAHELGHALGLGHSTVPGSLMGEEFVRTDQPQGALRVQPTDVEALRSLCPEL